MGLFGGFKAKFTKDSTSKSAKNTNKEEVVCLGYRIYSEFDGPQEYIPSKTEIKRPTVKTKTVQATSSPSNIEHGISQASTSTKTATNPKVTKSPRKKAPVVISTLVPNSAAQVRNNSTTLNEPQEFITISNENGGIETVNDKNPSSNSRTTENRQSDKTKEEPDKNQNILKTKKKVKSILKPVKVEQPILLPSSVETIDFINIEPIVLSSSNRNKSQHIETSVQAADVSNLEHKKEVKSILKPLKVEEPIYSSNVNRSLTVTAKKSTSSEVNGFSTKTTDFLTATKVDAQTAKAEVATYVHTEEVTKSTSSSATNTVTKSKTASTYYNNGVNQNRSTLGYTTSSAASIFFAGDDDDDEDINEVEEMTPGKKLLGIIASDEDRRSSADC